MTLVAVGHVSDFPSGSRTRILVQGRELVILNVDGELHAVRNRCPHQGGPVGEGPVTVTVRADSHTCWDPTVMRDMHVLRCPWHGMDYDLATGLAVGNHRYRFRVYETRVDADGTVEVVL